ncbi:uncharacterized protein M6B38_300240 [Iris pallida]|uniref:Uncharacterized protein n=1 Tax=Iris pallida TaxID=29817 RepID=A0AAX6HPU7_IRIPA|nr:uncharacterized protein M6B38_300240 [Iris pallida]
MTDMKGSTSGVKDFHALHKQWDDTSCPICMDHPHNAILLICSSHDKGCRSYICDTSYRHSNCLDRFKKLKVSNSENINSLLNSSLDNSEARTRRNLVETHETYNIDESNNRITTGMVEELEVNNNSLGEERTAVEVSSGGNAPELDCLKCPLCRGNVLGLMVVKEARQYLDLKPRSCSRETCSFFGNYRELRRHARRIHPTTRPSDVDPTRQRAWHRLEHQREYGDILSAVRSAMPGAIVLGDYVIDSGDALARDRENIGSDEGSGQWWPTFFMFHMLGSPIGSPDEPRGSSRTWRTHRRSSNNRNLWGENLLGLREDDDERNLDEDIPIPRRRRRFMRSRPDEE